MTTLQTHEEVNVDVHVQNCTLRERFMNTSY